MTRNLTPDCSWDVMLRLDSDATGSRVNPGNDGLVRFLAALPTMAAGTFPSTGRPPLRSWPTRCGECAADHAGRLRSDLRRLVAVLRSSRRRPVALAGWACTKHPGVSAFLTGIDATPFRDLVWGTRGPSRFVSWARRAFGRLDTFVLGFETGTAWDQGMRLSCGLASRASMRTSLQLSVGSSATRPMPAKPTLRRSAVERSGEHSFGDRRVAHGGEGVTRACAVVGSDPVRRRCSSPGVRAHPAHDRVSNATGDESCCTRGASRGSSLDRRPFRRHRHRAGHLG
jgi:hypothetical protein